MDNVDDVWTTVSLNAIAGQFDLFLSDYVNEICGVSIGMRKRLDVFLMKSSFHFLMTLSKRGFLHRLDFERKVARCSKDGRFYRGPPEGYRNSLVV
jgi:hypothetical protein